jgi:hypothetical protein
MGAALPEWLTADATAVHARALLLRPAATQFDRSERNESRNHNPTSIERGPTEFQRIAHVRSPGGRRPAPHSPTVGAAALWRPIDNWGLAAGEVEPRTTISRPVGSGIADPR